MPALGISLDRTAHARHAAARRTGRTKSRGLRARAACRMAERSGRGPSHRDRRCRDHGAHFHRPASEAARPRHPHARGGRTGLPWAHRRARCPTSRRMGRTSSPAGRGADCICPGPHRDLPVPASRPRCDDVTGSIHRCTRSAFRSPRPHGARADVIAVCALRRRTVRQTRLNRHRNRARRHARAWRGRAARRLRSRSRRLPAVRSKPCRPMRSCTAPSGV